MNCTCLWFIMSCHITLSSFIWHALSAWSSLVASIRRVASIQITLILRSQCCLNTVQVHSNSVVKFLIFSAIFMLVNLNIKSGFICIFQAKYFSLHVHLIYMTLCTYIDLSLKVYRFLLCNSISNSSKCSRNESDTMIIIALQSCG